MKVRGIPEVFHGFLATTIWSVHLSLSKREKSLSQVFFPYCYKSSFMQGFFVGVMCDMITG